jgi:hypothetical protein
LVRGIRTRSDLNSLFDREMHDACSTLQSKSRQRTNTLLQMKAVKQSKRLDMR